MTDGPETIDADAVQNRLPDGWTVENDGDSAVVGYATALEGTEFPDPARVPASFGIRQQLDLWTAVWLEPTESRGGRHESVDHITGTKRRCIEWIADQAATTGEASSERE